MEESEYNILIGRVGNGSGEGWAWSGSMGLLRMGRYLVPEWLCCSLGADVVLMEIGMKVSLKRIWRVELARGLI